MAATFDFRHTRTSDSISISLSVLPDSETMGIALECLCYHVYELRYTLFPTHFRLMAAIIDLRHTRTSDSIPTSFSVLPDPEIMGVAGGISLLSCVHAEIYVIPFLLPVNGHHR